jgi:hypothetical protein
MPEPLTFLIFIVIVIALPVAIYLTKGWRKRLRGLEN